MDYEVLVVGAGPVGLMVACELKLAGVSVLVVERLDKPDLTSKAGAINVPTMESFYRRGMLPNMLQAQEHNLERLKEFARQRLLERPELKASRKFSWHFSGMVLDPDKTESDPAFGGHGPAGNGGLIPQQAIEAMLEARALELGVELRRGVELTGFDVYDDGVVARLGDESLRAGWLVGCDGGHSMVRKYAGFDFVGTDPETTGHQAHVDIADPEKLGIGWNRTAKGVYMHGPHPGRILTVEFDRAPPDRNTPITMKDLQAGLRNVSETDVTLNGVLSNPTRFSDNARQSSTYHRGRVLLAGDAAHVHSPFGGQGLNLGIGDAFNLGWKLAATVQGWAPAGLLDSYTAERHPIGAWVLDWTRAQLALMRTDPATRALSELFDELLELPAVITHLMKKIAGVWQRYDMSGDHPLVGYSAPDLVLADGRQLGDCCHDGRAMLFDFSGDGRFAALAAGWSRRLHILRTSCTERPALAGLFVRPDGYVAWAADAGSSDVGLDAALTTWLGLPAIRHPAVAAEYV